MFEVCVSTDNTATASQITATASHFSSCPPNQDSIPQRICSSSCMLPSDFNDFAAWDCRSYGVIITVLAARGHRSQVSESLSEIRYLVTSKLYRRLDKDPRVSPTSTMWTKFRNLCPRRFLLAGESPVSQLPKMRRYKPLSRCLNRAYGRTSSTKG